MLILKIRGKEPGKKQPEEIPRKIVNIMQSILGPVASVFTCLKSDASSGFCVHMFKVGLSRSRKFFAKLKLSLDLFKKIPLFVWC